MPNLTKKDQAIELARQNPELSRKALVDVFVEQIHGISPSGAATYATMARKELGALERSRAKTNAYQAAKAQETDAQIEERLGTRFRVIEDLSGAACRGQVLSLIVAGAAGVGKSFVVEQAIKAYDPDETKSTVVRGMVRPTGLYLLLHEYRHKGNVIVLDDADSIFGDMDSLNLLKAALDTTQKRYISWRAETKMLDADGEPVERTFEFNGTIIFITNKDFDDEIARGGKMAEHYAALISRSFYVDCDMHTDREYLVRIKQVVLGAGMLRTKGLDHLGEAIVLKFIENHAGDLRELSLRIALKLADLYKLAPSSLYETAKVALFKRKHHH